MINNKKIILALILILPLFCSYLSENADAESCLNRGLLGNGDIFWGDPPPLDLFSVSPRAYSDVTVGPGEVVRISVEGEFPEDTQSGPDCDGVMIEVEVYPNGSNNAVRRLSGALRTGSGIVGGNLGSSQWYISWPHDLNDGQYRFKVTRVSGIPINSFVSSNILIVENAGPPPPPPTCTVSFTPATVNFGGTTTLAWSSTNDADGVVQYSCTGNIGSGNTMADGSTPVSPVSTQTCTFTAVNNGIMSGTCSATVTVAYAYSQSSYYAYSQSNYYNYSQSNYYNYSQSSYYAYSQTSYYTYSQSNYYNYSQSNYYNYSQTSYYTYSQSNYYSYSQSSYYIYSQSNYYVYGQSSYIVADPAPQSTDFALRIWNPLSGEVDTTKDLFDNAMTFLFYLSAPIIVIMIILSGVMFFLARGDSGKLKKAKDMLLYAIIGLAVILIGQGFVELIKSILALGE